METEPHISFENIPASAAVRDRVQREVDRLERFFGRITACRVIVRRPQARRRHGDLYAASVHLTLPGGREVHADRNPPDDHAHEDALVAIRDVFAAARRKLQDDVRVMRGDTKLHADQNIAVVRSLVAEDNYGFLETDDGREIYFHRNCVANSGFDDLRVGNRVVYSEEAGEKGAQATFVRQL